MMLFHDAYSLALEVNIYFAGSDLFIHMLLLKLQKRVLKHNNCPGLTLRDCVSVKNTFKFFTNSKSLKEMSVL